MFKSSLNNSPENVLNTHETFRVPHKFSNVAKVLLRLGKLMPGPYPGPMKDLRSGLMIKALGSQAFMVFFRLTDYMVLHGVFIDK